MTGRELAQALLALPNPDAPVFHWNPGEYWEPSGVSLHQDGAQPWAFIMVEHNLIDRTEISRICREQHNEAMKK